jgi:threonine dehydratase
VEVIGVQPSASPVMYESLKWGRVVEMRIGESIAEALLGGIDADSVTFDLCRRLVDDFIVVEEEAVREGVRWMVLRERQVAEGGGAIGVAALLSEPERFKDKRVAVIISGGNIDAELLIELLKR